MGVDVDVVTVASEVSDVEVKTQECFIVIVEIESRLGIPTGRLAINVEFRFKSSGVVVRIARVD